MLGVGGTTVIAKVAEGHLWQSVLPLAPPLGEPRRTAHCQLLAPNFQKKFQIGGANRKEVCYNTKNPLARLCAGAVGNADAAARANMNSVYLYTQYTAADPAITAQTGDDRPIEIMLVSALAFSALAAAAFLLDSKRKYRQS